MGGPTNNFGFGSEGDTGGGGAPIHGGGTLNFLAKFTPDGTHIGNSILYDTGSRIGLGTLTPVTLFEVSANNSNSIIISSRYSSDASETGFIGRKARGTAGAPTAVQVGDLLCSLAGAAYYSGGGGGFSTASGKATFYAAENFTNVAWGTNFGIFTTPIGSTVYTERVTVTSEGLTGFGTITPTAKIHAVGVDATAINYALKAQDNILTGLFQVRNDGLIEAGSQAGANQGSLVVGFGSTNLGATDINNTVFGLFCAPLLTGNRNSIFGASAMAAGTTASRNSAFGNGALGSNSTGLGHTAVGWTAGGTISGLQYLTAVGFAALNQCTVGENTAFGASAFETSTTSTGLVGVGYQVFQLHITGNNNTGVGYESGMRNVTGSNNTMLGCLSGTFNVAAGSDNVFVGYQSGLFSNNTGDGTGTVGRNRNTFLGTISGFAAIGDDCVFVGYGAGQNEANSDRFIVANNTNTLLYGKFDKKFLGIDKLTPLTTLHIGGSLSVKQVAKVANYAFGDNDYTVWADTDAITITLPNAVNFADRICIVKNRVATPSSITIASGGGTIDGNATDTITNSVVGFFNSRTYQSDGTNWNII